MKVLIYGYATGVFSSRKIAVKLSEGVALCSLEIRDADGGRPASARGVWVLPPPNPVVLSLPFALRYRMAWDAGLTTDVLNVFIRSLFGELGRRARERGIRAAKCGAVTFVQRFGDALNLQRRA